MQDRQRIIVDWMQAMIAKHGISARKWAESARLGKDTISRAMRDDYEHVTSTSTIAKLADAIGERPPGMAATIPSAGLLVTLLQEFVRVIPGASLPPQDVMMAVALGFRDTFLALADDPEAGSDPALAIGLTRAAVRRLDQPDA